MTDRELMQQALDALEWWEAEFGGNEAPEPAITALRERLAQPEQCQYPDCKCATESPCLKGLAQQEQELVIDCPRCGHCCPPQGIYYTPPQRTWVGLTDEQIRDLWSWSMTAEAERTANTQQHAFARAIEAKLKEKNT